MFDVESNAFQCHHPLNVITLSIPWIIIIIDNIYTISNSITIYIYEVDYILQYIGQYLYGITPTLAIPLLSFHKNDPLSWNGGDVYPANVARRLASF